MIRHVIRTLLIAVVLSVSATLSFGSQTQVQGISPLVHAYVKDKPFRLLVVEKRTQQLMLYEQNATLELLHTFPCATGENPGHKLESGDSRTPEGIYYITEIYEDSKITVFGSRAFHLDYPNIFDTHAGREGNGIFIHGTNKTLIPFSSNGCITLDNRDLDQLAPYLSINRIPIIIVESLTEPLNTGTPAISADSPMFRGILHELRFDTEDVPNDSINSLYFIEAGNEAVALVNYSVYDGESAKYSYHKKVYFTKSRSGNWRSLYSVDGQDAVPYLIAQKAAKTGSPIASPAVTATASPAVPAAPAVASAVDSSVSRMPAVLPPAAPPSKTVPVISKASTPPVTENNKVLLDFIERWRHSWSTKNLDDYMACYSPTFASGHYDKKKWRNKKEHLNQKYTFISVSIDNIKIKPTPTGALVSFYQSYTSDQYRTSGKKYLQLVLIDDKWQIQNEYM